MIIWKIKNFVFSKLILGFSNDWPTFLPFSQICKLLMFPRSPLWPPLSWMQCIYNIIINSIYLSSGQLSPENMQKVVIQALNTTQQKATEYYHWIYEKVQTSIKWALRVVRILFWFFLIYPLSDGCKTLYRTIQKFEILSLLKTD